MGTLGLCVVLNRSVFIPSTRKRSDTDLTEGTMKAFMLALVLMAGSAMANDQYELYQQEQGARFFSFNASDSSTTLVLLGAVVLAGALVFLAVSGSAGGLAAPFNRNDTQQGQYQYDQAQYQQQYRSNNNGFLDGLNIVSWISMLQDVYEKFDYNDLDCQKRLICEVMKEPGFYGAVAQKFKTGFRYAKYLEILDLPDDMRELLDEYMDANSRADQQKRNVADTNNL